MASREPVNPRDLQVGRSLGEHADAVALATHLQSVGIPCAIHQFPEFQGNWWAVCVDRKPHFTRAVGIAAAFQAGMSHATRPR